MQCQPGKVVSKTRGGGVGGGTVCICAAHIDHNKYSELPPKRVPPFSFWFWWPLIR